MNENYEKADLLVRELIDNDPVNCSRSLDVPRKVREKFEEFLVGGNFNRQLVVAENDEHIARKTLEFVHSDFEIPFSGSYKEHENRSVSFYSTCERRLNGESKVGNCLELTLLRLIYSHRMEFPTRPLDILLMWEIKNLGMLLWI